MKALPALALVAAFLFSPAPQARAETVPQMRDRSIIIQLSVIEAHKTMLPLCGVTEEEAGKLLEKDRAKEENFKGALTSGGKEALPAEMAKISDGVKKSWETTPEDQRRKSCDDLKAALSK